MKNYVKIFALPFNLSANIKASERHVLNALFKFKLTLVSINHHVSRSFLVRETYPAVSGFGLNFHFFYDDDYIVSKALQTLLPLFCGPLQCSLARTLL